MSKVDYERSPDGYQRLLEANIRITKAFGLPHYDATTNPGINDNFNEGGYIRYNDSVSPVIELYNGSTWSSIGADPIGPAGGDLTGTYPNPTINTINSITKSYYDPTSSIQTQINGKQATITTGSTTQYFRGDLSLATFPLALPPNGTAGGDLTGTYPNPTVNTINSITKSYYDPTSSIQTQLNSKQATLVSGTNIKTINSGTMLGSGNILLQTPLVAGTDYLTPSTASSTYQTLANLETTLTNSTTSYPSGSAITAAIASIGANNGLTNNAGVIQLGGNLNQNTNITGYGYIFNILATGTNVAIQDESINILTIDASTSAFTNLTMSPIALDFVVSSDGITQSSISIYNSIGGFLVREDIAQLGMYYSSDYSTNGLTNPRWIPDITSVNNAISAAIGGGSGSTGVNGLNGTSSIGLGGTLSSSNTSIDFAGNQLYLGTGNNYLQIDDTLNSFLFNVSDGTGNNAFFNLSASNGYALYYTPDGINYQGITNQFSYIVVEDSIKELGLLNDSDYSTNISANPFALAQFNNITQYAVPLSLTANLDIALNGFKITIGSINNKVAIDDTGNEVFIGASNGTSSGILDLTSSNVNLQYFDGSNSMYVTLFPGSMHVQDDINNIGFVNFADYSAAGTLNPLWLAQWGTVSSTFAPLLSPSLTTPTLGVASATSINKVTITQPASSATLTIANNKTFTSNNTLTLAGTDSSTLNIGTGGTLGTAAYTSSSSYLTTISGISASGELSGTYPSPSLSNSAVIGKVLTGYTSGSGTVLSTDSILQAIQKLNGNIAGLTTGVSAFNTRSGAITLTLTDVNSVSATTLGTVSTGVWQGTLIGSTYGGTGVNNGSSTITIGGSVTYSGSFTTTIAVSGNTSVTLPTSGTLYGTATGSITSAQMLASLSDETGTGALVFGTSPSLTTPALGTPSALVLTNATGLTSGQVTTALTFTPLNVAATTLPSSFLASSLTSIGIISTGTWQGTLLAGQYGGTGVANTGKTITLGGNFGTSGAFSTTLTVGASTNVTLPSTGTLSTLAGTESLTNKTINGNTITSGTGTLGLSNSVSYTIKGIGNTTLVSGTKAISITGVTTSSIAFVQLVSQGGTSTTVYAYKIVCTSGTITITAETVAGAQVTTDTSNVNYVVYN